MTQLKYEENSKGPSIFELLPGPKVLAVGTFLMICCLYSISTGISIFRKHKAEQWIDRGDLNDMAAYGRVEVAGRHFPEKAGAVILTEAAKRPNDLSSYVAVAAAQSPTNAAKIAHDVILGFPARAVEIAETASEAAPAAKREIVASAMRQVPGSAKALLAFLDTVPRDIVAGPVIPSGKLPNLPLGERGSRFGAPNAQVHVYYATDRISASSSGAAALYLNQRPTDAEIKYGVCTVNLPGTHLPRSYERTNIFDLVVPINPLRHRHLSATTELKPAAFYETLEIDLVSVRSRDLMLFVHGFNNSFEDGALRAAQLAYDLRFQGVTAFFSWPSANELKGYPADEDSVQIATPHLKEFIRDLADHTTVDRFFFVGHSLGCRALTQALKELAEEDSIVPPKVAEVILAAPDIDADLFRSLLAPALIEKKSAITIYGSSSDEALAMERKVRSGHPRVGDGGDRIFLSPGIETIDASAVETQFAADPFSHAYFVESNTVLADMFPIIHWQKAAADRYGLEEASNSAGRYWILPSDQTPNYELFTLSLVILCLCYAALVRWY
jgi:esterase/lipase superfamily enzyme